MSDQLDYYSSQGSSKLSTSLKWYAGRLSMSLSLICMTLCLLLTYIGVIFYREDFIPHRRADSAGYRLVPVFFGIILTLGGNVFFGTVGAIASWNQDKVARRIAIAAITFTVLYCVVYEVVPLTGFPLHL
jgi:hypothetical protein